MSKNFQKYDNIHTIKFQKTAKGLKQINQYTNFLNQVDFTTSRVLYFSCPLKVRFGKVRVKACPVALENRKKKKLKYVKKTREVVKSTRS